MSKEEEKINPVISSPEGAELKVDQELYDAADPDSALAITVHTTSSGSFCNFWINQFGTWRRVLPERAAEGEPNAFHLQGELIRLALNQELVGQVESDMRLRFGVMGLQIQIQALIRERQQEQS